MRAAIYARYSTENQNEKSTEDQIALCRAYAQRQGIEVIAAYQDKAKSGSSILGREGLHDLIHAANKGLFDVVIVEALDRLSRDMEDLAGLHKRFTFLGIQIKAVHEGEINTLIVGLRGLIGQMYREDTAHKVRRGLSALVKKGLSAGGKSYGYQPDPLNKGKFVINEEQAEIVREIYSDYLAGKSPRMIAHELNRRGIRPPRSKQWNASTLNGSGQRGSGILRNPIYTGQIVWNKVKFSKDPDTGKRVSKVNPESVWEYAEVPELRIVPQDLWDAVQEMKQTTSIVHPSHTRRPKRLLSGIVRCGSCGSSMVAGGRDKSGGTRLRCSGYSESNICPSPTSFYIRDVEQLVLDTLSKELTHPKGLGIFVEEYIAERRRLVRDKVARRSSILRKLNAASSEFERILDHLQKGTVEGDDVKGRLSELRELKKALQIELDHEPEMPKEVSLHPAAIANFRRQLANLHQALSEGMASGETEAAKFFRHIVQEIVVRREQATGKLQAEIRGELNSLLAFTTSSEEVRGKAGCGDPIRSQPLSGAVSGNDGCGGRI